MPQVMDARAIEGKVRNLLNYHTKKYKTTTITSEPNNKKNMPKPTSFSLKFSDTSSTSNASDSTQDTKTAFQTNSKAS
ncbi:15979_t:CDS:2 [Dentiscutata heterogama]|uniref:15979_t:CDS:1 n=1 Tax=Dentiscutata heterogama TaxID=1316150 RepID=A0ACA9N8L6_9GLOM|nr:15979_t:CDS:2 [Dentiscutata heterogama]